jgi:response regulator RpfG family c-di-GMP phosphodiesterase
MSKGTRVHTVLFVDDVEAFLQSLKRTCRNTGWHIMTALSGHEGLSLMKTAEIDLVVSDMRMPEMDGATFLERVKKSSPKTIRVLLTGYSDIDLTIDAINKGKIFSYITKPWDNEELRQALQQALHVKLLESERQRLELLTQQQNEELKVLNERLEEKVLVRTRALQITHKKLKESYHNSVEVLAGLLERRSEHASSHGRRVAAICQKMVNVLELDAETGEQIYFAAILHEIGKIGLPDHLMDMAYDQMSRKEQLVYEKHSKRGESTLLAVEYLHEAALYIRHHLESFDGKGFPDQLQGDNIPFGAQLIGLASYYDELSSGLYGRQPLFGEALEKALQAKAGSRFDGQLMLSFLEQFHEGNLAETKAADRLLAVEDLEAGMVLSRDVYTPDGRLILSNSRELSEQVITKLRRFQRETDGLLRICVFN